MKFASLGSGSKGNSTLVYSDDTYIMVDCGFSAKETSARLGKIGLDPTKINAIVLTHEHGDHVKGAGTFSRRYKTPIWSTFGTYQKAKLGKLPAIHYISPHGGSFQIKNINVTPYAVPHDAKEPCQYIFQSDHKKLAILTDIGCITPHILKHLQHIDGLLLEANHDYQMLQRGTYPPSVKKRVSGNMGHLNNMQTIELLKQLDYQRLKTLVIGHLSAQNNCVDMVSNEIKKAITALQSPFNILTQDAPSQWFLVA